jgi:hypothetical protein
VKPDYNKTTFAKHLTKCIGKRNAYHQAGCAAAICIGNKQKNLPAVHFQIVIKLAGKTCEFNGRSLLNPQKYYAKLEGGRLIPNLPYSYQDAIQLLSPDEQLQCRCAFEADVINMLAASLAEAKYVALRDGEIFNANLVYLGALKFYGGSMDLLTVDEYMDCLYQDNKTERNQKLTELFLAAYFFVNQPANWQAINTLAERLCQCPQDIFTCEELIALLEPSYSPGIDELTNAHMGELLEIRQTL